LFESKRQYQLPVGARRYADSKPVTQGAVPCTGANIKARHLSVAGFLRLWHVAVDCCLEPLEPRGNIGRDGHNDNNRQSDRQHSKAEKCQ
jgi:hypothetical protein